MNSFLFNVNLTLTASVSVTLFSCRAFSLYTRNSDITLIFLGQIQYLEFFNYFFEYYVFEVALLAWTGLCGIILILLPA
jgi:LMBR1 domain-containing protein 1